MSEEEKCYDLRLQQTTNEFLLAHGPYNAFVTLTSRSVHGVSKDEMTKLAGSFVHGLKSYLYGRKSKKQVRIAPVIEGYWRESRLAKRLGIRQGTHIHALIYLPGAPTDHRDAIREIWMKCGSTCGDPKVSCPNSDHWFLDISPQHKQRIYMGYALKNCLHDTDGVLWKFVPTRPAT